MIKFLGLGIMLIGIALLIATLINAKRGGSSKAAAELSLILDSGYADTHREAKRGSRLQEDLNVPKDIKIAPKKRTLSKEAQEILELVEKERAAERDSFEAPPAKKPGRLKDSTGIMPKRGKASQESTDILNRDGKPSSKGTDILNRDKGAAPKVKKDGSTDILKREKAHAPQEGTDILTRNPAGEEKDAGGTDILNRKSSSDGTDILQRKAGKDSGTDILSRKPAQEKTGILKRETATESRTDILERRR